MNRIRQSCYGNSSWTDMVFEMFPTRKGANEKPDWDSTNIGFLFPQNDATEKLWVVAQMPHQWKVGSTIYPHVHVRQARDEQATFKIDYQWYDIGDTIPSAATYTMNTYAITYSSGTIAQLIKGSGGISGAGLGISSILKIVLYRQDNVYGADMLVDQFDIHYEVDSLGSNEEYTK